jgi:hypothetical protein
MTPPELAGERPALRNGSRVEIAGFGNRCKVASDKRLALDYL